MKGTSSTLKAHMAGASLTLAHLVKLTRLDGTVYGFTDHDRDITYSGTTYVASNGITASAVESSAELNVDNLELKSFLSAIGVSEADIAAGLWDYCSVRVMRVNWADLTMLDEKIKRGWIGQISQGRDAFVSELRSLTVKLQQPIGELYSPSCKADLYDARCKVVASVALYRFDSIPVTTIVTAQRQWTSTSLTNPVGFFTAGKVTWTSGLNTGLSKEIKVHAASGNITLQEPMPYVVSVGDIFTIYAGCQKRYAEDCLAKFANTDNFRGHPFLPGADATLRGF